MRVLRTMELALAIAILALLLSTMGHLAPRPATGSAPIPADARSRAAGGASDTKTLLDAAADRHQLPRTLVEATAYWESGWDESKVSDTGAVGLMQIQPEVAADMGPRLVGHLVDLHDAAANADLGAAILRAYIDDQGGNVDAGLAAYYEGPGTLAASGFAYDTADYVNGVEAIRGMLDRGEGLPPPP